MLTIEQLTLNWNSLAEADRVLYWNDFTEMLDAGDAGYHRYYLILMPVWTGELAVATAGLMMPQGVAGAGYKPFHFPQQLAA